MTFKEDWDDENLCEDFTVDQYAFKPYRLGRACRLDLRLKTVPTLIYISQLQHACSMFKLITNPVIGTPFNCA